MCVSPAWVQIPTARRTSSLSPRAVKGVFLGLTLPLCSRSLYALINSKVVFSTDVVCLQSSDDMVSPRPSEASQEVLDTSEVMDISSAPPPASAFGFQSLSVPSSLRQSPRLLSQLHAAQPAVTLQLPPDQSPPASPHNPLKLHVGPAPAASTDSDSMPKLEWSTASESADTASELCSPGIDMEIDLPVSSGNVLTNPHTNPFLEDNMDSDDDAASCLPLQTSLNHLSTRVSKPTQRYGYVTYAPPSSADFSKHLSDILSRAPELHHALVANTGLFPDPKSIAEAPSHDRPDSTLWRLAIDNEFQSLIDKGVYAEALLPPGARLIGTRS